MAAIEPSPAASGSSVRSALDAWHGSAETLVAEVGRSKFAVRPFDDATMGLCAALSGRLLRLRDHPEAVALGFWMRPAALTGMRARFEASIPHNQIAVPRGLAFHVTPANVDTMFVYSWVLSLLMGLALLLTACPADDDPADEPEPDADVDVDEEPDEPDDAEEEPDEPDAEPDEDMGEPVTLTLGHGFPDTHHISVNVLERFAEEVAEATDGTVEVDIVPGGALGPPDGTYENVVAGGQELGWSLQGYTAGRFPITQIVEAPFVFESGVQATEALWDLYEEYPEFQEEYGDVKVIAIWTHDVGDIWLSDQQVETMEDLQGQTLRAPGPMQFDLLERLGVAPEFMPAPELYDAIDRGVLDGLMIANSGLDSYNLFELLNYGVLCNCYVATQFFVMNQGAWDSLSPQQQDAIDELAGRTVSLWAAEDYDEHYDASIEQIEEAGIEQFVLDDNPDEFERWQEVGDEVLDDWISEREAEGVPAQEMVERLRELAGS